MSSIFIVDYFSPMMYFFCLFSFKKNNMIKKILKTFVLLWLVLIPNFSSADNTYIENVPSDFVIWNYSYSVDNNINFTTNSTWNFIEYRYTPRYNKFYHFFGWIDSKLYYVSYDIQQVQWYLQWRQGFINSFCSASSLSNRCTNFNVSAEDFYSMNKDITKIAIIIWWNDYADPFWLCFYNSLDELYYCAQWAYAAFSNYNYYSSLTGSLWFSSESEIRNYNRWFSPFNKSTPLPDYSVNPWQCLSNTEVLMWFEYMWLSQEYCYWGFSMDNLFLPWESFEDFTGYSFGYGTTIFNLHYVYSWGLSMKPFLSSYYQSFLNGQLNNFYNKSKALLMFFQQYQSANDRGRGDFNLNDLYDYCTLLFTLTENNWANDNECYTWWNKSAPISYNLNKSSNNWGFNFTWVLGWNWTWFSTPDEFFGRLNTLFQTNINWIDSTFPSMIPSYIVFFLLAIILIRIISH